MRTFLISQKLVFTLPLSAIISLASISDLSGILQLQSENLKQNIAPDQQLKQGFVTVQHSLSQLENLHAMAPQVVAVHQSNVVAYLLTMTAESKTAVPLLIPMFQLFEKINHNGKPLAQYRYVVVGQVCIDKAFRGQGLLDKCYAFYRQTFLSQYDFAITEIDARNIRSLAAHKRIGFKTIHTYSSEGVQWQVVIWDWRQ